MWITQKTTCQFGRRAQLRAENLSILPSVDPYADLMTALSVSPICPTSRSIASADTKQPFGAKPARSCLLSMHWIVANHKIEGAVSVLAAGNARRPRDAQTIELPDPSTRSTQSSAGAIERSEQIVVGRTLGLFRQTAWSFTSNK